jgi:hypothetical protein
VLHAVCKGYHPFWTNRPGQLALHIKPVYLKINHALHLTVLHIVLSHFTDHTVFSFSHASLGKLHTERNKNNINSSIKNSDQVNVDYVQHISFISLKHCIFEPVLVNSVISTSKSMALNNKQRHIMYQWLLFV